MFGMGFGEILIVVILAIIFLGPEKLPDALIQMAKFFRTIKKNLIEAKESIDQEINIAQMKQEALSFKQNITKIANEAKEETAIGGREIKDLFGDLNTPITNKKQQIKNKES